MRAQLRFLAITMATALISSWPAQAQERVQTDTATDLGQTLRRLRCGTQVGLLKVLSPTGQVQFDKGLDTDINVPISGRQREAIFEALALDPNDPAGLAQQIMTSYELLPKQKALALLGVAASANPYNQGQILDFLCARMEAPTHSDADRILVRSAGLALASADQLNPDVVHRVANFFARVDNRWLEYPVVEIFKQHGSYVRGLPDLADICGCIQETPSFYADVILRSLSEGR